MRELTCKHCNGKVSDISTNDQKCPNCGMPLPPNLDASPRKRFKLWFIALVIFCIAMMIWLPQFD